MITAAIFDIDGTLLDSMDMWNHAGEEYLHSLGIQPKPGLAERMMPLSTPKSAQLLQREYALEKSVSEIIDGINGTVRSAYLHTVPLKPGVKDFLEEIKSKKIPMTAATSTDPVSYTHLSSTKLSVSHNLCISASRLTTFPLFSISACKMR